MIVYFRFTLCRQQKYIAIEQMFSEKYFNTIYSYC